MTVVNTETGEITETIPAAEARRLTTEAQNEFRSSREHFDRAWSLIEQAVTGGGHVALGYRSPGDYLHAEFDGVLSGLDITERRLAVRTMTEWGLSTRAIAPVIGTSHMSVKRDREAGVTPAGVTPVTPEPEPTFVSATEALATLATQGASPDAEDPAPVEQESNEAPADVQPEGEGAPSSATEVPSNASPRPPATVTGIDGKTYLRPVPASRPKPAADEFTDHDRAEELARNLARNLSLLYALTSPERRAEYIATWREGTADLKPLGWDFITPAHMRELSAALLDFASEWEKAHA